MPVPYIKVRFLIETYVEGNRKKPGAIMELHADLARSLIAMGKAERSDAPAPAQATAKPKG